MAEFSPWLKRSADWARARRRLLWSLGEGLPGAKRHFIGSRRALYSRRAEPVVAQPTIPANPKVGVLGASRHKHNVLGQNPTGTASVLYSFQCGWLEWAYILGNNIFEFPVWEDASNYSNANGTNGFCFAQDGQVFQQMERRIPKILASDIDLLIFNINISSIGQIGDTGVTDYCNYAEDIMMEMYGQIHLVTDNVWERGTGSGGSWAISGLARTQTPTINSTLAAWQATKAIEQMDFRSKLIDLVGANHQPIATYMRSADMTSTTTDVTHLGNIGGYELARDVVAPKFNTIIPFSPRPDPLRAGNLHPNPTFTGTGGTVGTGGSGTLPDGATFTRTGAAVTAAFSILNEPPVDTGRFGVSNVKKIQAVLSNASGLSAGVREGGTIAFTVTGLTVDHWYEFASLVEHLVATNSGGIMMSINDGSNAVIALMPITAGGTNADFFNVATLPVTQDAWSGRVRTHYLKAKATSVTVRFYFAAVAGAGTPTFKFALPEVREISDPTRHFAQTGPLTFLSSNSFSGPEEAAGTFQILTSIPCQFGNQTKIWSGQSGTGYGGAAAITGTDAINSGITIDPNGLAAWASRDYENPADADANNVYALTWTATPFDPSIAEVSQNVTFTITDVNDGYSDAFNGVSGTDLAVYSANWTRVGSSGAIKINSGGTKAQNTASFGSTAYYFAPQQGNTYQQTVIAKLGDNSLKMSVVCIGTNDGQTWIKWVPTATDLTFSYQIAGGSITTLGTVSGTTDLYKGMASNDYITTRIYGNNLYVYQNSVLVKTFDLSTSMTAGAGAAANWASIQACRYSGLRNNNSAASGTLESWNNRVSAATYDALVGLRAITATPTSITTGGGVLVLLTLAGQTAGSSLSITNVKKNTVASSEEWVQDGSFIRGTSPSTGTWTMDVIENYPNSPNDGRTSSISVVIS